MESYQTEFNSWTLAKMKDSTWKWSDYEAAEATYVQHRKDGYTPTTSFRYAKSQVTQTIVIDRPDEGCNTEEHY